MALSSLAPSIGSILKRNLPFDDVRWACAYGSAVFSQKGYKEEDRKKSMVDLIVAVDDPHTFHKKNLQQNPHHYATLMRNLGANSIVSLQNSGAGIYYNTLVPIEDRNWKYGVISTERLVRDLQDWDTMYVAGRLHKPVYIIKDEKAYYPPNLPSIQEAINKNLNSAVIVALLLKAVESNDLDTFSASGNPRVDISIPELYECIAALSYRGDIRFHLRAENKDKVKNIVKANEEGFNKLYEPAIKKLLQEKGNESYRTHMSIEVKREWMSQLPFEVREVMKNKPLSSLIPAIGDTTFKSSFSQTLKGLLTGGLRKSFTYALEKHQKGRQ